MQSKLTDEDRIVFETLSNPIACTEILFSDLDNLSEFNKDKFSNIRTYQFPFFSFESLFVEDEKLTKKENFKIKKGLGDIYAFGGRLTGKTLLVIIVDCLLSFWHRTFKWGAVSSVDATKVRGVMDKIVLALENHPILSSLDTHSVAHPAYRVTSRNGCLLESVNNNAEGKEPGKNWYQKHVDKNWEEESGFLTDEVSNKRLMAQSENGMVERMGGMTTFTKNSPIGRIFFNEKLKNRVINYPSFANYTFDKEKEEAAILEFGGKNSIGYQIQIAGKVVEGCNNYFDMERVGLCYNRKKPLKGFEINKFIFSMYKELLVIERPNNIDSLGIYLDVGEGSAPTEIIVIGKIENKYKYLYNITTFKMSSDEDYEILKYIAEILQMNVMGIDVTSGGGKALATRLEKDFSGHIVGVAFNEKINIDFAKDELGNFITDTKGNYTYKQEFITDWSMQRLKHLFYNDLIEIPFDNKLDLQISNIVSMKSGMRTIYGSKVANHLAQAFQVFAIAEWNTEFLNLKPIETKKMGKGFFNW